MTQIKNIIKFKFGHKEIQFPRKVLIYYPWLNNMFGGGDVGEIKNELEYNIVEYLSNVNTGDIRCMLKSLLHLQNLYNEDDDDEDTEELTMDTTIGGLYFNKDFYYTYFLDKTESFLKNGPGFTKGLDIPFVCTKCNDETYHPYMIKPTIAKHDIEIIGNMMALCKICGNTWSAHNQNQTLNQAHCCISQECIHDWK